MKSERLTAQLGLLAAAAVLVTSLGILVSNGGDTSPQSAPASSVGTSSQQAPATPMTLSANADSSTASVAQR